MGHDLSELIASLPEDLREPAREEPELRELISALAGKKVPTGRVARMWSMGSMQARIAIAYALTWMRERFATPEEREALRDDAHVKAAAELLAGMSYLRGAAMKVGQTLASYPEIVPKQVVDTLEALHFQAPPMHFSLLREQVRRELGSDPEELFREFDTEAFAAASLGQVHRARLKSGEEVAVKVQYPNIARTIEADFKNLRALIQPLRVLGDWKNRIDMLDDVRATLDAETDYVRELAAMDRARSLLADMDDVVVPRTYAELSSKRVLTMERVPGVHLRELLARKPDKALRDHHGTQILRVNYRLWCSGRMIHADPNPGNYVFLDDRRLGLLDFGCVREMDDDEWGVMLAGIRAARDRSDENMRALIQRSLLLSDEELADRDRYDVVERSVDWLWEPLATDEPFDFSDGEYLKRGFEILSELVRKRYTRTMPVFTWMNRMLYGVRGLFFSLGAELPYKRINDEELERAGL